MDLLALCQKELMLDFKICNLVRPWFDQLFFSIDRSSLTFLCYIWVEISLWHLDVMYLTLKRGGDVDLGTVSLKDNKFVFSGKL